MPPVTHLHVDPVRGGLRFRLEADANRAAHALDEEIVQSVDDATLDALAAAARATLARHAAAIADVVATGGLLYRTLLPERLREPLRRLDDPLLVMSSVRAIPWELLHDGDTFWGLRYPLGHRLRLERALPAPRPRPRRTRPRALVIGADRRGDLPAVDAEIEAVTATLERFANVTCMHGPLATFDAVTAALREAPDLIHYAGHATIEGGMPGLVLADGVRLTAPVIERNLAGRPIVMLNACASAQPGDDPQTAEALAAGFLLGGAAAAIGTHVPVGDRDAAAVATAFWTDCGSGAPLGDALRTARAAPKGGHETAGLAFALYGDPARTLGTVDPVARPARRLPLVLGAIAVALLLVTGLRWWRTPGPLIVGVNAVEVTAGDVAPAIRQLTRDGIVTLLTDVPDLQVYSSEYLDFACPDPTRCGIQTARDLGMHITVFVRLASDGENVTLELRATDLAHGGLAQRPVRVHGALHDLIALRNDAVFQLLDGLGRPLADADRRRLQERYSNDDFDALHLMLQTMPGMAPAAPPSPASAPHSWWRPWTANAWAQDLAPDERDVRSLLEQYRAAIEQKDLERIGALQVAFTPEQRAALQRYFDAATDLHLRFADVEVVIDGLRAVATLTREDRFHDTRTGRDMDLRLRVTAHLRKLDGAWKMDLSATP